MMSADAPIRSKTAEGILDLAETLIQTRGYTAFSHQDIADALKIGKASIHYHFPSKTDLGLAVVDRYSQRFGAALAQIAADSKQSSMAMLDHYVAPYLELAKTTDNVCLRGALASEMMALPGELRTRVDRFFREHQAWLAGILARGAERGEFCLNTKPTKWPASSSEPFKELCWSSARRAMHHNSRTLSPFSSHNCRAPPNCLSSLVLGLHGKPGFSCVHDRARSVLQKHDQGVVFRALHSTVGDLLRGNGCDDFFLPAVPAMFL